MSFEREIEYKRQLNLQRRKENLELDNLNNFDNPGNFGAEAIMPFLVEESPAKLESEEEQRKAKSQMDSVRRAAEAKKELAKEKAKDVAKEAVKKAVKKAVSAAAKKAAAAAARVTGAAAVKAIGAAAVAGGPVTLIILGVIILLLIILYIIAFCSVNPWHEWILLGSGAYICTMMELGGYAEKVYEWVESLL